MLNLCTFNTCIDRNFPYLDQIQITSYSLFLKISVEAKITLGWSVQKTKSKKLRPSTNINNHLPSPNIDGDQMQNRPIRGADRQRRISDRNGHDHTQGNASFFVPKKIMFPKIFNSLSFFVKKCV